MAGLIRMGSIMISVRTVKAFCIQIKRAAPITMMNLMRTRVTIVTLTTSVSSTHVHINREKNIITIESTTLTTMGNAILTTTKVSTTV